MTEHRPVLLIEDHEDIRESMALTLRLMGFAVEEAENGQVALDKLRAGLVPCLILLDLTMPVMDGFMFRRQQLQLAPVADVPVIVYSGLYDVNATIEQLGAVAGFQKPIEPKALVSLVQQHC